MTVSHRCPLSELALPLHWPVGLEFQGIWQRPSLPCNRGTNYPVFPPAGWLYHSWDLARMLLWPSSVDLLSVVEGWASLSARLSNTVQTSIPGIPGFPCEESFQPFGRTSKTWKKCVPRNPEATLPRAVCVKIGFENK